MYIFSHNPLVILTKFSGNILLTLKLCHLHSIENQSISKSADQFSKIYGYITGYSRSSGHRLSEEVRWCKSATDLVCQLTKFGGIGRCMPVVDENYHVLKSVCFLADCTNGRTYATVLRPLSSLCRRRRL